MTTRRSARKTRMASPGLVLSAEEVHKVPGPAGGMHLACKAAGRNGDVEGEMSREHARLRPRRRLRSKSLCAPSCTPRQAAPWRCLQLRPLRAMHCPLCNLTHASRALTGVASRWQAGVGEVPRILLDEIQARAPPDAIVHMSQAG